MTATDGRRIRRSGPAGGALLAAAVALAALTLTGCSPGAGSGGSSDSAGSSGSRVEGGAAADDQAASAVQVARGSTASTASTRSGVAPQQAAVISTGAVSLRSREVGRVVDAVRRTVSGYDGSVQKESTDTDDEGRPTSSRLTLRVPSARFAVAMQDLGGLATLQSSSSSTKDVTTVVLDNQVRVQVAQRSIDRISTLLDQAASIKDVIAIESELAQRQADLASLESQQKYLADQTSMATIEVTVEQAPAAPPDRTQRAGLGAGFGAGLAAGWHALGHTATAVATAGGALLPWLVVLGLLGGPLVLVLRRRRRPRIAA